MEKYEERQEAQKLADLEEAQQMLGEQQEQDTLTAEDITDLQLVDSEYMSGTRTTIHDFDCKVKGEENQLQYTLEYHDDGEGFTIHTEKDDIWNRMSTQELERLDVKLGQEVLYYHYHNKTVNADTLDKLREIREEIMEEESSYFTAISNRVWTDYDKKEKELSGEVEVSEEKESLEEINGISEPIRELFWNASGESKPVQTLWCGIGQHVKEQLFEYANLIGEEEKVRTLVRNLADAVIQADEEGVEDLLDDARMDIQDLPDPTIKLHREQHKRQGLRQKPPWLR